MPLPTHDAVMEALDRVIDPELRRPVTDLGMVSSVDIAEDGVVSVEVLLTVAGCPLKDTITADTQREVGSVEGVTGVQVSLGVMNDEQKAELRRRLRGGAAEPVVPFTQPVDVNDGVTLMIRTVADAFALGVQLAAPIIVFSLVLNVSVGLISRVMPQFQIFFVTSPLSVLMGLSILALGLGIIGVVWADRYRALLQIFN